MSSLGQAASAGPLSDPAADVRAWMQAGCLAAGLADNRPDQWRLGSLLELGAAPGAVPCARRYTRQRLREWGLTRFAEAAELVVSELLTNAVQASCATESCPPVRLWLASDTHQVLILVWDSSLQPPIRMDAADGSEHGRGLTLVEAISTQWNWYFPRDPGGKVVWAQLAAECL